ncbi:MAG: EamA family transporter [Proteobacteria bacterium]|nr:EamA family transporter [Pseudomonadota bacterium]
MGVVFALASASFWGTGDFAGGLSARRINEFQVLVLALISGIIIITLLAIVKGEALPNLESSVWASLAGVSGGLGIAALYRGLALGKAAVVAPTAAVIGAALPILFGLVFEGVPQSTQIAGFLAGITGIWLLARFPSGSGDDVRSGLLLAFLAGVGFGSFFILIAQVEPDKILTPLLVAKAVALCVALVILFTKSLGLPPIRHSPIALLAGLLETGGSIFYLWATQFTRLDVAAVLSSMYPAATIFLAGLIVKETVSPTQWAGVALCLVAVALIAV